MRFGLSFRRFARAEGGLAAVEFALLAPIMITLLLGTVEVIDALGANRRVQNTAASLADVVARDTEISDAEVTGFWEAIDVLMFPDQAADTLDVRITSITIESPTEARVVWSEALNAFAPLPDDDLVDLPDDMMNPGTSIIMTETVYHYDPPLAFLFGDDVTMTHTAYRRSRIVDPIPRV